MITYVLISVSLIFYFEFLGQYVSNKFSLNNYISGFGVGLLSFFGLTYVLTSILTAIGTYAAIVFVIYAVLFFTGFILIAKNGRTIAKGINLKSLIIIFLFTAVLCCYSYKTTMGNLYGFDAEYYVNYVSTNSFTEKLNQVYPSYGVDVINKAEFFQYSFQTYYYVVAFLLKVFRFVFNSINVKFNNLSFIVWTFQIVYNYLFVSLLLNTIYKYSKKNVLYVAFVIVIQILFYGKLYFNNVYGFFGNSYRTVTFGYFALLLFDYINNKKCNKWCLYFVLMSTCAFTSSSTFIIAFLIFGCFFAFANDEKGIFKDTAIVLLFPLINLISYLTANIKKGIIISIVVCFVMYIFNDLLVKITRDNRVKVSLLIVVTISMMLLSYKTTGSLLNFSAFFDNNSANADMTINYANIFGTNITNIYSFIVVLMFFYYLIRNYKNKFSIICISLLIAVFNPLCCSYLNSINAVYYRAYDIFVNPCTFVIYSSFFFESFKTKYISSILEIIIIVIFVLKVNIFKPIYYHESFIPSDDYNGVLRMTNDEYNAIKYISDNSEFKKISKPVILNSNLLTQTQIPRGVFIFSRTKEPWHIYGSKYELFSIFYPVEDLGEDERPGNNDVDNLEYYVKDSNVDYIVVDKRLEYYDKEDQLYEYLYLKMQEIEYKDIYENDSFIVLAYK